MTNTVNSRAGLSASSWVAIILVALGAINWGLVGLFGFDLVAAVFGVMTPLSRIIYVLIGVAGIYLVAVAARMRETTQLR